MNHVAAVHASPRVVLRTVWSTEDIYSAEYLGAPRLGTLEPLAGKEAPRSGASLIKECEILPGLPSMRVRKTSCSRFYRQATTKTFVFRTP